jgi:hypothetical protein
MGGLAEVRDPEFKKVGSFGELEDYAPVVAGVEF